MLHHVSVGVRDVARAASFYDPVLGALGYKRVMEFLPHAIAYGENKNHPEFWIQLPHNQQLSTNGNGTHVGFVARSKEAVGEFHAAALKAGGSNDGEPGPRPDYGPEYYGAFIYDLDGNKIEATLRTLVANASKKAERVAQREARRAESGAKKAARAAKREARGTSNQAKKAERVAKREARRADKKAQRVAKREERKGKKGKDKKDKE